ncbi:MAG: helix-turn-helix domain-containing protein [Rickettsiales bacterium]|jgi:transcriptional regulator with XRE-family HTH domain|nr:helix-turn-helix domain-containing protein [Rickettsiales bacterium]
MLEKSLAEKRFNLELGHAIHARRLDLGTSQIELSEKTGIGYNKIRKYESGFSTISLHQLDKILRVMRGL